MTDVASMSARGQTAGTVASTVAIINAGVGNLGNLARAVRHVGADCVITEDAEVIRRSRCLMLPGVGAFKPPRERMRGAREEALHAALDAGAWLLGICVGFQLLFEGGEEFGTLDGLALLPGRVTRLPETVPLPHIGWNRLVGLADIPLFAGLTEGDAVYFVHSFAPQDVPADVTVAQAVHGRPFCAVAARGRIAGTQFHPEKSGQVGLRLLRNFLVQAGAGEPPCN
jgi:glutamine amidotransferase